MGKRVCGTLFQLSDEELLKIKATIFALTSFCSAEVEKEKHYHATYFIQCVGSTYSVFQQQCAVTDKAMYFISF